MYMCIYIYIYTHLIDSAGSGDDGGGVLPRGVVPVVGVVDLYIYIYILVK